MIHVHSTFSDGTPTVPEIIAAARAARADAVLLTDHDSRQAAREGLEGWHGDVLLLVGHEVTTRRGHLLAFGVPDPIEHHGLSEDEICARLRDRGGFGFAAHPFSEGGRMSRTIIRPHPWDAIERGCPPGIELWSLLTDIGERWRHPLEAWRFLRAPERWLIGPPAPHLAAWDRLGRRRRTPAIGGLDAHQNGLRVGGHSLTPLPNERVFTWLRTHVQLSASPTGELAVDRRAVYEALREGRCYLAMDWLDDARGFDFRATGGDGRALTMGSELGAGEWTLVAHSPAPARLQLLRDGAAVHEAEGRRLEWAARAPGVYRVQALRDHAGRERQWILSNPVYLR